MIGAMTENLLKLLPETDLLENVPHDPQVLRAAAEFKRLADMWRLDADFRKRFRSDPEKAIAQTGLAIEPEAFRLYAYPEEAEKLLSDISEGRLGPDAVPESYLLYRAAVLEFQQLHQKQKEILCVPDEPRFWNWRNRQEKRCRLQIGPSADNMLQFPLVFELSEGCSVGCPFCALAAQGLKGVFRYTRENAQLWREVLFRLHVLIGSAAGYGICYYATEGLDNPDYEKFLADWYREFGVVPPTTTAASTRDIERTRAFLRFNKTHGYYVDRFSVLSPAMRDTLFAAFTPEELFKVLMLPQFPEAPGCRMTKAGRNRRQGDPEGGTISCVSGFIVNMQNQTVRLTTPFTSDEAHPTGEWILETRTFTSAADLETQIRQMTEQYMPEKMDPDTPLSPAFDFCLREKGNRVMACAGGREAVLLNTFAGQEALDFLTDVLKEQRYTSREILDMLAERTDVMLSYLLMSLLWHHGLICNVKGSDSFALGIREASESGGSEGRAGGVTPGGAGYV